MSGPKGRRSIPESRAAAWLRALGDNPVVEALEDGLLLLVAAGAYAILVAAYRAQPFLAWALIAAAALPVAVALACLLRNRGRRDEARFGALLRAGRWLLLYLAAITLLVLPTLIIDYLLQLAFHPTTP